MDALIFIIIIAVIVHNFRKQQKRVQKPPQSAPAPQSELKPVQTVQNVKPPAARTTAGRLPRPFSPEMRSLEPKPNAPRNEDSPAQGTSPARRQPAAATRDMGLNCDDGYGSLPHTGHEGQELHAPGAHSDAVISARYAPKPCKATIKLDSSEQGGILGEISIADACAGEDQTPMLLGSELSADEMRRAVILSEVLSRRGGRRGWART